jgi:hypothetical protein
MSTFRDPMILVGFEENFELQRARKNLTTDDTDNTDSPGSEKFSFIS